MRLGVCPKSFGEAAATFIRTAYTVHTASAVQVLCLAAGAIKDSIVGEERLVRHLLLELAHQPYYTGASCSHLLAGSI